MPSLSAITPGRSIMVLVIVLSFVVLGLNNLSLRRSAVATSTAALCATSNGFARDLLHHLVGQYPTATIIVWGPAKPDDCLHP